MGSQGRMVCSRQMMTQPPSSAQGWLFLMDIDGPLHTSLKKSVVLVQNRHVSIERRDFSPLDIEFCIYYEYVQNYCLLF